MINLSINTFYRKDITTAWSDTELFRYWIGRQRTRSGWLADKPLEVFVDDYQTFIREMWHIREGLGVFRLPNNAKVLDIGSGCSVLDLFLSKYLTESIYYLVDKSKEEYTNGKVYSNEYVYYNDWNVVRDGIRSSNLDINRFHLLDPDDEFPNDIDLIMSNFSWCWHFPLETYINKVIRSLKQNGKLFLTVRLLEDRNIIDDISNYMNSYPIFVPAMITNQIQTEKNAIKLINKDVYAVQALWQRNV